MQWSVNLPSYNPTYEGAWQGSQSAQQGQVNSGAAMWAQLLAQQQAQAAQQHAGWQQLQAGVQNRLKGANKANLQDIADKYTAMSGQMSQQLIDRGLGNTTVQQSVQRGVAADQSKESTRSRNEFAKTMAGYMAQVGGAGLGADAQSSALLAGLGKGQIDWLTGINIGYPDRNAFNQSSGFGGYGGGGGGAIYPAMQGMHHFASDVQPMQYEGGYGGGGGMGGYTGGYSPNYSSGLAVAPTGIPIGIGAYTNPYGGGGGGFDYAGLGGAIGMGAGSAGMAMAPAQSLQQYTDMSGMTF